MTVLSPEDVTGLIERLEGDSLDAIVEVVGEGPDFAAYNRGKGVMRQWFLCNLPDALAALSAKVEPVASLPPETGGAVPEGWMTPALRRAVEDRIAKLIAQNAEDYIEAVRVDIDELRGYLAAAPASPAPAGQAVGVTLVYSVGFETTAEDRASWTKRADDAGRLARDFAKLLAARHSSDAGADADV